MFAKNDKRRLYWLIEMYLSDSIDASTFCDEFYYSYSLEINYTDLSNMETTYFTELNTVIDRFSPFEKDQKLYPGVFFTEKELKKKILDTKEKLQKEYPTGLISEMRFNNYISLMDIEVVKALWYNRLATLKECTEQLLKFLIILRDHNPILFVNWYDQRRKNKLDLNYQSVKKLLSAWIDNDELYPEKSYKASCWNGFPGELGVSFYVELGTGGHRSYPNQFYLKLPSSGLQYEYYKNPVNQEMIIKLFRKHWNPDVMMIKPKQECFIELY